MPMFAKHLNLSGVAFSRRDKSNRGHISVLALAAATLLAAVTSLFALETPFTPYMDGYATASSYTGNSRTVIVRSDSKAWVSHALLDGAGKGLLGARLQVYVKDIVHDGQLKVYLATSLNTLENQTHFSDLKAKDSLGVATLKGADQIQRMVEIPLAPAFVKSLQDGSYAGLILTADGGLDAELGALEGSHGAILYLNYASAGGVSGADTTLVDSVAAKLAKDYKTQLQGAAGGNGLKGAKGDTGLQGPKGDIGVTGPAGPQGVKGDVGATGPSGPKGDTGVQGLKGDRGTSGLPGDQSLTFNLLEDRGARAYYTFNRFSVDFSTTPDSSGQGNPLTISILGKDIVQQAPGDSIVNFLGSGYAYAPNSESLNPYREITLSAKVKLATPPPASPDTETIISKKNQYEMAVIDSVPMVRINTTLGSSGWVGAGKISNGSWAVVQATYDGKAIRTFINGKQAYFKSFMGGPIALDSANLYLGARGVSLRTMKGSLDSVKILSYCIPSQDAPTDILAVATSKQLSLDSVPGLRAALNATAPINSPNFTGGLLLSSLNYGLKITDTGHDGILTLLGDSEGSRIISGKGQGGNRNLRFEDSANGETMRISSSGNVGLGNSAPTAKLDILDTSRNLLKVLNTNLDYGSGVSGSYAANSMTARFGALSTGNLTGLEVNLSNAGTGKSFAAVFNGGNVGIGTSSPTNLLQVYGSSQSGEIRIGGQNGPGQGRVYIRANTLDDNSYLDAYGDDAYKSFRIGSNPLLLNYADGTGNVGVGTATPVSKLDLNGTFSVHGVGVPTTGVGVEVDYGGIANTGRIFAYDRVNSVYKDFRVGNGLAVLAGGNVGIGTASPGAKLGVDPQGAGGIIIGDTSPGKTYLSIQISAASGGYSTLQSIKSQGSFYGNLLLNPSGGKVSIGNIDTTEKLNVAGNILAVATTYTSDIRFKKNIRPIDSASWKIDSLRGVTYDWKIDEYPNRGFAAGTQYGFIAQEVEKVAPELVHTNVDGFKSVDYVKVTPLLVEAVKSQDKTIKELSRQLTEFKSAFCAEKPDASICASLK